MMFDFFFTFFLVHPHRLTVIGRVVYRSAAFQIVAGMVAQFISMAVAGDNAVRPMLKHLFPDLWTWWIPESVAGAVLVATIGAIGLCIAYEGRQYERLMRSS